MKISDIISAIEACIPVSSQESWDNSGLQVAGSNPGAECSGVLLCVDVTPEVIAEAQSRGCNLVVSHHPLIFRGLKHLTGDSQPEICAIEAIRRGIAVYSCHTPADVAAGIGLSHEMGRRLGLADVRVLSPRPADPAAGIGVIGHLPAPTDCDNFITLVKGVYDEPTVRTSRFRPETVYTVALGTGSCGEFIPDALSLGADAYISSDIRYHDFVDFGNRLLLVDTTHYSSELCAKTVFSRIISEKFPNFAVYLSETEQNPITFK